MSAPTIKLNIGLGVEPLRRSLAQTRWDLGRISIALSVASGRWSRRERLRRELALAREIQADYPRWDVQVVTCNDGRCRLISRPLGGWR